MTADAPGPVGDAAAGPRPTAEQPRPAPTWASLLAALRRDRQRYDELGAAWHRHAGFWIGATYRVGAWSRTLPAPARWLVRAAVWFARQPSRLLLHVELPDTARIGPGLCIVHPYNVLVGGGVELGADCRLFHEVTIGLGVTPGFPTLGDDVHVFVGARVLGGIRIGAGVRVGANCVVSADVPAGAVVPSPPSRPIPQALLDRSRRGDSG